MLNGDSRKVFIEHHDQLGLSLRLAKLDAIAEGDTSGRIVAPVLVFLAQLTGCRLWRHRTRQLADRATEGIQFGCVSRALAVTDDLVTRLQVHTVLTIHYLIGLDMNEGGEHLGAAAQIVVENREHFLSPSVATPDSSYPNLAEHLGALSQFIYLDKAANIVLDLKPMLPDWLESGYLDLLVSSPFRTSCAR